MGEVFFVLLWGATFLVPVFLYTMSRLNVYNNLRASAVHPFNVLGFFLVFINANFMYVYIQIANGHSVKFARTSINSFDEVLAGMVFFICLAFSILLGVYAAQKTHIRIKAKSDIVDANVTRLVFWAIAAIASIVSISIISYSLAKGSLFYVSGIRQIYFRENIISQIIISVMAPAAILAITSKSSGGVFNNRWIIALVSMAILFPVGSRGALLYIIIALFVFLVSQGLRINVLWTYLSAPFVAIFLIFYGYFRDGGYLRASFSKYLEEKSDTLIFGSLNFQNAEPIILAANYKMLDRWPGETFLAMLVAPLPRSLVTWKPEGPSAEYSALADLQRWVWTKSEYVITGFANLSIEFGVLGAIICVFLLSWLWAYLLRRAAIKGGEGYAFTTVILIVCAYIFVRGDLYNLSLFLWPVAFVLVAKFVASKLLLIFRGQKNYSDNNLKRL